MRIIRKKYNTDESSTEWRGCCRVHDQPDFLCWGELTSRDIIEELEAEAAIEPQINTD